MYSYSVEEISRAIREEREREASQARAVALADSQPFRVRVAHSLAHLALKLDPKTQEISLHTPARSHS